MHNSAGVLGLLRDVESATINSLSWRSGIDSRAIRIALLAASGENLVEVDASFQNWRLTEDGRRRFD